MKKIKHFLSYLIISGIAFSNSDTAIVKTYYEKFEEAVQYFKEGRFRLSEYYFNILLTEDRDHRDPAAQIFIAKSQLQQGLWDKSRRTCKSILANYPNSPYNVDIYVLLGDCAFNEGKITLAFKNYITARKLIEDLAYINDIDERLYNCLGLGLSEEKIEGMLFRERNNFNRSIINLARCYQAWLNGDHYNMESMINDIDTYYLPGKFSRLYGKLKNSATEFSGKPITFGLIIPLTGIHKDIGESYFFGLIESLKLQNIRFLVYDSEGLGSKSLKILKDIHDNKSITAVLGPLTNDEVYVLSGTMLDIPILIPKPAPTGLSSLNQNLFFLTPSIKTLAERTAQLIINELGYSTIAILSPGYGKNKFNTDYFIDECHQLGVDPVAIEWYVETPLDLSRQLKNIREKAWDLIPSEDVSNEIIDLEIDSLDALFDVDVQDFFTLPSDDENKMDKKDSSKVELETIQAIYIPIGPDELTYVGTQLPFYNLKTNIFGNANWLNLQLLNQEVIGPHVQGMHIISDISSTILNDVDDPNVYYYNIAYEHVSFLESIVEMGFQSRRQFAQKIRGHKGYFGKKTSIVFSGEQKNENGSTQILQYSNQKIKILGVYDGKTYNKMIE